MSDNVDELDIVYRLKIRANIRRTIAHRKSVQEGKPDRISDLLEEAAEEITNLRYQLAKRKSLFWFLKK